MLTCTVSLADRYVARQGPILISGVQALVRLMLLQADRDRAAGRVTGGFVSGYRGSPLGTLDRAFAGAAAPLAASNIVVRPAVNEELAATAVAGSQQIAQTPGARVAGVFALWYGKGPGFDRATDAIRHGNIQGSSPHGGVVVAVGDDHVAKSSSIVCDSDATVASVRLPLLYPADAAEIVAYGLHGFAMSRHSGSWIALKIITEVADATRVVATDELATPPVMPPVDVPTVGLHNRWPDMPLDQEARQHDHRLPAVAAYVRANGLDRIVAKPAGARLGIIAAGKSWLDLQEAFALLGGDAMAGVALYKPAMIWPLEATQLKAFAVGLATLIVVEEKASFVEDQVKAVLYGTPHAPAVFGQTGPDEGQLFPGTGDLTPEAIAMHLGVFLAAPDAPRTAWLGAALAIQRQFVVAPLTRKAFFCAGCPHNRSTVVPEGSRALAGIGCHGLAAYHRPGTSSFAQMGGEGIHWLGLAPFTDEPHVFANMGDGTYFHSGLLAIRQAVAAQLTITYRLLYNGAVAMTGGQPVDGALSVDGLIDQLCAEGVATIALVSDDPARFGRDAALRRRVGRIAHRDDLAAIQTNLRVTPGVSVIVYDQMCATEKRRLRKRGKLPPPAQRVIINELVCEGCGDCSVQSNCLAVEPVATPFGTKRRINQSSCNTDTSCVAGFCPSFVTVAGAVLPAGRGSGHAAPAVPPEPPPAAGHQRVLVAGVGGTGVVTIGALLVMAAHLRGQRAAVLDQTGMAQKGGAVLSHVHVAATPIHALRIPAGMADLVLAGDAVVANGRDVMGAIDCTRTRVVVDTDVAITSDFIRDATATPEAAGLAQRLGDRVPVDRCLAFPFTRLATLLLGDAVGANLMMVGAACQKGWLPVDGAALGQAVELNATAVAMNLAAFGWGRALAADPDAVLAAAGLGEPPAPTLDALIAGRADFLVAYQDRAYADRFVRTIAAVRAAEARLDAGTSLTGAAARSLFKLLAYKDEYEVARLHAGAAFRASLDRQVGRNGRLTFHLAPPLFARRDPLTGVPRKRVFGPWMLPVFAMMARLRGLRGTAFDPFGRTAERRIERALAADFERLLGVIAADVTAATLPVAVEIARLPLQIRGYGHVKARSVTTYGTALDALVTRFRSPQPPGPRRTKPVVEAVSA